MEANPLSVFLVKSDSKGDRLLFRYPYVGDSRIEQNQQNRKKNPYALSVAEDLLLSPPPQSFNIEKGQLIGFTDEVLSTLFAVKQELCDNKFELKVNDVRFVGHPTLLQTSNRSKFSPESKQNNPSILLIHIVFALQAVASHSIVKCYYDLSKRLGVALRHEERRCGYVTQEMKTMIAAHDDIAAREEKEGKTSEENISPFDLILQQCSLARDLKSAYDDLCSNGVVKLRINRWIELSFCLTQKVHQSLTQKVYKGFMIEPEAIDRCLENLRPYHGLLLLVDQNLLLDSFPPDASPALTRLVSMYSPLKNLQTLSADADLTLAQVFNLAGHLVYWGNAMIIYPICESNMYTLSADAPTHVNSPLVEKFSEHFVGECLLQMMSEFSLPISIRQKSSPLDAAQFETQLAHMIVWMLQHRLLTQLHTYVYFMPSEKGLGPAANSHQELQETPSATVVTRREGSLQSTPDEMPHVASESDLSSIVSDDLSGLTPQSQMNNWLNETVWRDDYLTDFTEEEKSAILKIPASSNPEDLKLLVHLIHQGYCQGQHHLEEIMYLENVRRSQLLQLLDKFRDVLVTCQTEDPALSIFYSHPYS
ncbi:GATOR complex protein NPRL3 isoform X1 [Nilaparvata lugens]|uniref:GATOR complex protein NPRL3 isoform X1 n=1 Tax=Nilaparvata lugens TaxID=108931 RepID=UPI00193C9CBB|nr:GATOR complex protein NPRL3 isoform X1 [Nilaparvata lugens]